MAATLSQARRTNSKGGDKMVWNSNHSICEAIRRGEVRDSDRACGWGVGKAPSFKAAFSNHAPV